MQPAMTTPKNGRHRRRTLEEEFAEFSYAASSHVTFAGFRSGHLLKLILG